MAEEPNQQITPRVKRRLWRRLFRRRKRQVENMGNQAEQQLERHFFRRISRLNEVRRFVFSWLFLMMLIIGLLVVQIATLDRYYLELKPIAGGTFTEGILGNFTNANPIYASGSVDTAISKLVFAGLFAAGQDNSLVGDIADRWTADDKGQTYTINLKNNVYWHDGVQLTSQDVVFTYNTIQNPDTKSPLLGSWQGIAVSAPDNFTVVFKLPNPLGSFPYSLTNGIVPKHLLASIPIAQLRSSGFNAVNPVGCGPFKWQTIEVSGDSPETREEQIGLTPFDNYFLGKPRLSRFLVRTFHDERAMIDSFSHRELNAMAGLDAVPDTLLGDKDVHESNIPVNGQVDAFFRTSEGPLADKNVREALVMAVDRPKLINQLGFPVPSSDAPILSWQFGYTKAVTELGYDQTKADSLLTTAGWPRAFDGKRVNKDGKQLAFRIYTQSTSEYQLVSKSLQDQWGQLGIDVQVSLLAADDLQSIIAQHAYDVLLYGISIGLDPDVFAYWHSSQADPRASSRFNFSEYKSTVADRALESGRTRIDPILRAAKYRPFLDAWRTDAPALALYQPRFLYIVRGEIFGFGPQSITSASDRFSNISNWMIRKAKLPKE